MKFYECRHCGNIITYQREVAPSVACCGQVMQEMEPNTTDASNEKHMPVMQVDGRTVTVYVGKAEHPMTEEHSIQWVILETGRGYQKRFLQPAVEPKATFTLQEDDEVRSAYEYCNLHGLWKNRREQ